MLVPLSPIPVSVYPSGVQGPTLLVNSTLNPMTVSDQSAPLSGFVLPPGGSMTWPDKTPLYVRGFAGDYLQVGGAAIDYTNANAVATQLANTTLVTTGGGSGGGSTAPTSIGAWSELTNLADVGARINDINVESDGTNFAIAGGYDNANGVSLRYYRRMSPTGSFPVTSPSLPVGISHAATYVTPDGALVMLSGFQDNTVSASYYTVNNGSSSSGTGMDTQFRRYAPASCVADGVYYMACGSTTTQATQGTGALRKFAAPTGAATTLADASSNRTGPTLVPFKGKLWLLGGVDQNGDNLGTVRLYDVAGNSWTDGPTMPEVMGQGSAAVINGTLFAWCVSNTFYRCDGTTWTKLPVTLPWTVGFGVRMRALGTNLYVFGGSATNKIGKAAVS